VNASNSALRRSLRACTLDGAGAAAMIGFGETYFPAFALLLGATPFQVGVIATVPILVGAAFQLMATVAAHRIGDRLWVIGSATLQVIVFFPIAWLARSRNGGFPLLFVWVCVYWMLNLGLGPAWNAWMGRMIPPLIRSRFFGRRNVAVQSLMFLSLLAGGFLIDAAQRTNLGAGVGFAASFALAAISRGVSVWFLSGQHDPGTGVQVARASTRSYVARFRHQPYGRVILLIVLMIGSVHISAAYFTPYMLHALNLSYARFTILTGTSVVARILSSPYWGEIARSYGNRRALQVSAALIIPLSSLWLVSDHFGYLMALQAVAGFAWAGFELTMVLNLFDCTSDENRAQVLSIFSLLNGVMIVTGSLLGGSVIHALGDHGYAVIFVASSLCRAAVMLTMASGVGVRRRSDEHSFRNVFLRVITLRRGAGEDVDVVVLEEEPRQRAHSRPPRQDGKR
jgi:MFS family permease